MSEIPGDDARAAVEAVYRAESRRVLATLIRLLGDFDLAEEAPHEAVAQLPLAPSTSTATWRRRA